MDKKTEALFRTGLTIDNMYDDHLYDPLALHRALESLYDQGFDAGRATAQAESEQVIAEAIRVRLVDDHEAIAHAQGGPMGGWGVIGGRADNGERTAPPEGAVVTDAE